MERLLTLASAPAPPLCPPESPVFSVWSSSFWSSSCLSVCLPVTRDVCACVSILQSLLLGQDPTPAFQPSLLQPQCLSLREEILLAAHNIWPAGPPLSCPLGQWPLCSVHRDRLLGLVGTAVWRLAWESLVGLPSRENQGSSQVLQAQAIYKRALGHEKEGLGLIPSYRHGFSLCAPALAPSAGGWGSSSRGFSRF